MRNRRKLKNTSAVESLEVRTLLTDTYGSGYVENALVHYIQPEVSNGESVVMVPGRNLSSSIFVGTPDGRDGWAQIFAGAGYDVYVMNDPDFDFSRGFNVAPLTVPVEGAPDADPTAQQAYQTDVWEDWGFGTSEGNPYSDTRFPTDNFAAFEANYPYVTNAGRSYSSSLEAVLELVGPSILLGHSAGATTVVRAAKDRPELVTDLVFIEPAGVPDANEFPELAEKSMLGVYGDYIDSRTQQASRKLQTEAAAALFSANGGIGDVISLPDDYGIAGNTHLMMQDNNSEFIAGLIIDWLEDYAGNTYGSMYVDQALVHSVVPDQSNGIPIIMVPGHNLSGDIYLETPDGRAGWAQMFAAKGYEVYVINDPEYDFSRGFNINPFQNVPTEGAPPADPDSSLPWADQDIWRRWGFGESEGTPYPDAQFPTDHFDTFEANYPHVGGDRRNFGDAITTLLEQLGPSLLMAHSAGGPQAVAAAMNRPDLTEGIILVEPTGPPDEDNFPTLSGISMLGVYGDYVDSRNQTSRKVATEAAATLFTANGGAGDVISLPEDHNVFGNSHLLMQGLNNEFTAALMTDWLATNITNVDLRATSFDADSDHVRRGRTEVTYSIENSGSSAAGAFETNIVWSANDIFGDDDDVVVLNATRTIDGLGPQQTVTVTVPVRLSRSVLLANSTGADAPSQAVGTMSTDKSRLFLVVDSGDTVAERTEGNNSGQNHLVDSDDVTYFPWDFDGNGTVTPLEALNSIHAIGAASDVHDLDGNGIVTPLEALHVLQRIGYFRNDTVIEEAVILPAVAESEYVEMTEIASTSAPTPKAQNASKISQGSIVDDNNRGVFSDVNDDSRSMILMLDDNKGEVSVDSPFAEQLDWLDAISGGSSYGL